MIRSIWASDLEHCEYLCSFGGGGGGGSGTQNVRQTSEPPEYLAPYLEDIARKAQVAYGRVSQQPYRGQLTAAVDPLQHASLQRTQALAPQLGSAGSITRNLGELTAGGAYIAGNPYLARPTLRLPDLNLPSDVNFNVSPSRSVGAAIESATSPVLRNLREIALPQLAGDATNAGAFGSSQYARLAENLISDASREASRIASEIAFQDVAQQRDLALSQYGIDVGAATDIYGRQLDAAVEPYLAELALASETYNRERALQNAAPSLIAQGTELILAEPQLTGQVGTTRRGFEQEYLDEAYQHYLLEQSAPFLGLPEYASIVQPGAAGFGESVSNTVNRANPFNQAILGALGGGGLGYGIGSLAGAAGVAGFAPYVVPGLVLGGLLGGVFG